MLKAEIESTIRDCIPKNNDVHVADIITSYMDIKELHDKYSFVHLIQRVLKQVHPETQITKDAKKNINNKIHAIIKNIVDGKYVKLEDIRKRTIDILKGELAKHALREGNKMIANPNYYHGQNIYKRCIRKTMMYLSKQNVDEKAVLFMAAVIEYLIAEIIELAGNNTRNHRRGRINTYDVSLAIIDDDELQQLVGLKKTKHNILALEFLNYILKGIGKNEIEEIRKFKCNIFSLDAKSITENMNQDFYKMFPRTYRQNIAEDKYLFHVVRILKAISAVFGHLFIEEEYIVITRIYNVCVKKCYKKIIMFDKTNQTKF